VLEQEQRPPNSALSRFVATIMIQPQSRKKATNRKTGRRRQRQRPVVVVVVVAVVVNVPAVEEERMTTSTTTAAAAEQQEVKNKGKKEEEETLVVDHHTTTPPRPAEESAAVAASEPVPTEQVEDTLDFCLTRLVISDTDRQIPPEAPALDDAEPLLLEDDAAAVVESIAAEVDIADAATTVAYSIALEQVDIADAATIVANSIVALEQGDIAADVWCSKKNLLC
jgi:hypothetical protein